MLILRKRVFDDEGRGLNLFQTHDRCHVKPLKGQFPSRYQFVHGTQRGLHNTAGYAEDIGGTRGESQRRVKASFRQIDEIDARRLDHPRPFPGRQNRIHIPVSVYFHLAPLDLILLRRTRHHGDDIQIPGIHGKAVRIE